MTMVASTTSVMDASLPIIVVVEDERQREPFGTVLQDDNPLPNPPQLEGSVPSSRIIRPVSHWSPKVAGLAAVVSGISTGLGIALWAVPPLNPLAPYFFYFAVPAGGISLGVHILSACYLNRFIPQRALEEQIDIAEGTTVNLQDAPNRLRHSEIALGERVENMQRITQEKAVIIQSMKENQEHLQVDIEAFSRQSEVQRERMEELGRQIIVLRSLKTEISSRYDWLKEENKSLAQNMAKMEILVESLKTSIHDFKEWDAVDKDSNGVTKDFLESVEMSYRKIQEWHLTALTAISDLKEFIAKESVFLTSFNKQLDQVSSRFETGLNRFVEQNSRLDENLEKLVSWKAELSQFTDLLKNHHTQLETLADQLKGEEHITQGWIRAQAQFLEERDRGLRAFKEQFIAMQNLIAFIQEENTQLKVTLEGHHRQEEAFLEQVKSLQVALTLSEAQATGLKQDRLAYQEHGRLLEELIGQYHVLNEQLQKSLELLNQKLAICEESK